jgi:hypothetical protein
MLQTMLKLEGESRPFTFHVSKVNVVCHELGTLKLVHKAHGHHTPTWRHSQSLQDPLLSAHCVELDVFLLRTLSSHTTIPHRRFFPRPVCINLLLILSSTNRRPLPLPSS